MSKELKLTNKPVKSNSFSSSRLAYEVQHPYYQIACVEEVPVMQGGKAFEKAIRGKQMAQQLAVTFGKEIKQVTEVRVHNYNSYERPNLKSAIEAMVELRAYESGEDCYIIVPERLSNAVALTLSRHGLGFKDVITNEAIEELNLTSIRNREAFINEVLTVREYFA